MIKLPLLDTGHLAEIEALETVRPGLREQMLELFAGSVRGSIAACNSAWSADDHDGLAQAAHRLKGSAASLGAVRLRVSASQLEKDAWDRSGTTIPAHRLEALDCVLEDTIAAYKQWLENGE